MHNFPIAHDITHYYQNVRRNLSGNLQHLLDVLQGLVILDQVREHAQLLHIVSYDIVKGVAYQTRLEPGERSTPSVKRMCLLTFLDVRNAACNLAV